MNPQPLIKLLQGKGENSGSLCTGIIGSLSNGMGGSLCPEFAVIVNGLSKQDVMNSKMHNVDIILRKGACIVLSNIVNSSTSLERIFSVVKGGFH